MIETDDHLVDLFGKLIGAAGLAPTVCGPIGPRQLFENLTKAAPFLTDTYVRPEDGLATVQTPSFDLAWSVFTNGQLSVAVFVLIRFDDNFSGHLLRLVMQPFSDMAKASGCSSSIASKGSADEDVAAAMRGARSVPMDLLLAGGDIHSTPVGQPPFLPPEQGTAYGSVPAPHHPPQLEPTAHASAFTTSQPLHANGLHPGSQQHSVTGPPTVTPAPRPVAPAPPPPPPAPPQPRPQPVPAGPPPDGGRLLTPGANTPLSDSPGTTDLLVELGWFVNAPGLELDATAILLGDDRRACSDRHFVFFNNPKSPDGAVELVGDRQTTPGGYEVATISVRLDMLSPEVESIVFPVAIYDAATQNQSFGMIPSTYARVRSHDAAQSQATFVMTNHLTATETAMVFCEVYRRGSAWKLRAIGQGYASGLAGIATDYGVDVG
ncbi:TerD family protein [Gordonia alkanivorans]|uniref:TerD family protein n=1 Tax=Gordonia alkanivorans TaxID=84096 RepID=UPI001FC9A7A0|nr:TerD family protein [Gordonia alkanivorans]